MVIKMVFSICFLLSCISCKESFLPKYQIESIAFLNNTDSIKNEDSFIINRSNYFLVRNWDKSKEDSGYKFLSEFSKKYLDSFPLKKLYQFDLIFYKESSETNIKNLKQNVRILDRYSQDHDLIFIYYTIYGKVSTQKVKNGEFISDKKFDVIDTNDEK